MRKNLVGAMSSIKVSDRVECCTAELKVSVSAMLIIMNRLVLLGAEANRGLVVPVS